MSTIPVIGCPILNRGDLLNRMVASIDYPVGKLVIVDNGQDSEVRGVLAQIVEEGRFDLHVHRPGYNMGVSSSWNWIIENNPDAKYWLLVGNDIQFMPGDLAKIDAFVRAHLNYVVMPANHGHSLFVVTPHGRDTIGPFDANYFPGYLEDSDHMTKIKLSGEPWQDVPNIRSLHGEAPTFGSHTIYADPILFSKNQITHKNNLTYYISKWGGPPGAEVYQTPYNDPQLTFKDWRIDEALAIANENIELCKRLNRAVDSSGKPLL